MHCIFLCVISRSCHPTYSLGAGAELKDDTVVGLCKISSADNGDMIVRRTRTVHYGPRSFRIVAPQIWNMLPPHLNNCNVSREQFKSGFKTWPVAKDIMCVRA